MKKLLLIFSLFLFIPVLNAEETNYFDWPQVSVESLPTASSDTLNKVYIVDNNYYITKSESVNFVPEYLQLNTSYKDIPIYFNPQPLIDYYQQNGCSASIKWVTSNVFDFQFICYSGNSTGPGIRNATLYTNTGTTMQAPSNVTYYLWNANASWYVSKFISTNSFSISAVTSGYEWLYHSFTLNDPTQSITYTWDQVNEQQVFPVIQNKIYVPSNNLTCYHFTSNGLLRGYLGTPVVNEDITYYDFDIHNHYNSVKGVESITDNPVCLANTTTNYLYRNDIVEVLLFAFLVGFIVIFIPLKILLALFKRRF